MNEPPQLEDGSCAGEIKDENGEGITAATGMKQRRRDRGMSRG